MASRVVDIIPFREGGEYVNNGDLRDLADALDEVEETVLSANKMIGRIEVNLPDRPDEVVGHFERFNGDPDSGWGFREKQ